MEDRLLLEKYPILTIEQHIGEKDMWAGSKERIEAAEWLFAPSRPALAVMSKIAYSPALLKCVDEPLVNAIDHAIASGTVRYINIALSRESGEISIANDGEGIEVARHPANGQWIPDYLFGTVLSGSNMKKAKDSVIGGVNGVGVKITNIHSLQFRIRTLDSRRGLLYSQRWESHMSRRYEPRIGRPAAGTEGNQAGTMVSFIPDYVGTFAYKSPAEAAAELENLIFTRAVYAAIYVPNVSIAFNGVPIAATIESVAAGIFPTLMGKRRASVSPAIRCFDVSSRIAGRIAISASVDHSFAISVINGVVVRHGSHIKRLTDTLKSALRAKIASMINGAATIDSAQITKRLAIVAVLKVPGAGWSSQSKDYLSVSAPLLAGLVVPESIIDELAKDIFPLIAPKIDGLDIAPRARRSAKVDVPADKYVPAKLAGTRYSARCRLLVAEGNSAMGQVKTGIANVLGADYFGALSLGGVIINSRKESSVVGTTEDGDNVFYRSKKMLANLFMNNIVAVLGLDFAQRYENPADRKSLRYGGIIACVDQDYDGVGNIFSLLLSLFERFWPGLLAAGYVQRIATPIIRAFPARGGAVLEFYNDDEYRHWERAVRPGTYKIEYYKGLGTNDRDEILQVYKTMDSRTLTYRPDERAHDYFEIYLGANPDLRKHQLSQPPLPIEDVAQQERAIAASREVPCSYHLRHDADAYQRDNLERKLDSAVDGLNQSARKILNGCFRAFAKGNPKMKVSQLAGHISKTENYHHGEESLSKSISRKAFVAVGGKQLPHLVPLSSFGTRAEGGKDAASARYIKTKLNSHLTDVLFPPDDYSLLDFNIDEGKRGEPAFFVPIIPLAIIESSEIPAHGWKMKVWAREVMDVIANVRRLINTRPASGCPLTALMMPMRPCVFPLGQQALDFVASGAPAEQAAFDIEAGYRVVYDGTGAPAAAHIWKGRILELLRGRSAWAVGAYRRVDKDNIIITELPLCRWTVPYVQALEKKAKAADEGIQALVDRSSDRDIHIEVRFSPDFLDRLLTSDSDPETAWDPVIEYLKLRVRMSDNLNFMLHDHRVHSFTSYAEVVAYWYPFRKELYAQRIERQLAILSLWITYYNNVIRYIDENPPVKGLPIADAKALLESRMYTKIDTGKLRALRCVRDVRAAVLGPAASFDYLLDLRDRDRTAEGRETFASARERRKAAWGALTEQRDGGLFPGARLWLRELDALEEAIRHGRQTEWRYDEYGKFTFGGQ